MVADTCYSFFASLRIIVALRRFCFRSTFCIYSVLMKEKINAYESIVGIMLLCAALFLMSDRILFIYMLLAVGFVTAASQKLRDFISIYWMKLWIAVGKVVSVIPLLLIFSYLTLIGVFKKILNKPMPEKNTNFKTSTQVFNKEYFEKSW